MILRRMPDDVTILTPTAGTDAYGNATAGWDTPTETTTHGWLQPRSSREGAVTIGAATRLGTADGGQQLITSEYRLFVPPDTAVTARDRVRIAGDTFAVVGDPRLIRGLSNQYVLALDLTRSEG